ncbi:ATP/GTP-binding protein [Streptomyces cyaneus]|uniref:ATP/GTP-binding protein n=1 Tax=Streptomyces cyaneus TaxID=1904 RepID=UPI0013E3CD2A|nr:ATP/GTP-binding protein [Streptomyces cyaneus]
MSDTRPSWGGRLAAGWGRLEPTITRLFLFAVFVIGLVAQFVKPVGDALADKVYLGGSLVTVVGYVLYAEVQRLNGRLDSEMQRLNSGRVVTPRELVSEFQEALEGRDVRLAAMGFTGETLAAPLKTFLQELSENKQRKVSIRVLVPDFTRQIEVPGFVDADGKVCDSPAFRAELREQIAAYERSLKEQKGRMAVANRGTLTVEFRVLHMSPSLKLYFINDRVYEGIYDKIDLRPEPWTTGTPAQPGPDPADGRLLDLIGYDSLLTRWSPDGGAHDRMMIRRRQEFFETLWNAAREPAPAIPHPTRPDAS